MKDENVFLLNQSGSRFSDSNSSPHAAFLSPVVSGPATRCGIDLLPRTGKNEKGGSSPVHLCLSHLHTFQQSPLCLAIGEKKHTLFDTRQLPIKHHEPRFIFGRGSVESGVDSLIYHSDRCGASQGFSCEIRRAVMSHRFDGSSIVQVQKMVVVLLMMAPGCCVFVCVCVCAFYKKESISWQYL